MVKFKLSIILGCVILPPLLYILTIQWLEHHAGNTIQADLKMVFIGDVQQLLTGSVPLKQAVQDNIDAYLRKSRWLKWGGKAVVTVKTRRDTLLYPLSDIYDDSLSELDLQPVQVAAENYRLINEDPEVSLSFKLPHNTFLTNGLLGIYILAALSVLLGYYRHWFAQYKQAAQSQDSERRRLSRIAGEYQDKLDVLSIEQDKMISELSQMTAQLNEAKNQADATEDEMIDEIVALEEKIAAKAAFQEAQQQAIDQMQEKIDQLEQKLQKERGSKRSSTDIIRKRFAVLYKNLVIHDRAVEGYLVLVDDLKIKCEEVIHQLNDDPGSVAVKRKVFGKKNRLTVLEVVFGYKGRLYFRPKGPKQSELLAIGTKNTQQKELEYLDRL